MTTVIKSKQLIIDAGDAPVQGGVVVIEGERVVAVGAADKVSVPENATVMDCSAYTVMPGLIDSHIHITANNKLKIPLFEHFSLDLTTATLRGIGNLRTDLASGVTTMRTLGDRDDVEVRFRNAIERGEVVGPRLKVCIRALRPSHGTAGNIAHAVDGPEAIQRFIRENFYMGADLVKLFVSNVANGDTFVDYIQGDLTRVAAYSKAEIAAAVEQAQFLGMPVACHAIGGDAMRWAMEVGVDSVEHCNLMEEQDVAYFEKYGTFLSDPNLQLFFDDEEGFPSFPTWQYPWWRAKVEEAAECTARWLPEVVKRGTKVCLAGDSTHAELWREAMYMVKIGCSVKDALLAVTKNSAELLRMSDDVGTLHAGKFADVIAIEGDPYASIADLRNVRMVMKAGREYVLND